MEHFCQCEKQVPLGEDILNAAETCLHQLAKFLRKIESDIASRRESHTLTPSTLAELRSRHDEARTELSHYHHHLGPLRDEVLWMKRLYKYQLQQHTIF